MPERISVQIIHIDVPNLGQIMLRDDYIMLTIEQFEKGELQRLQPRDFTVRIISDHLVDDTVPKEAIHAWSDETLRLIITEWSKAIGRAEKAIEVLDFSAFQEQELEYLEKTTSELYQSLKSTFEQLTSVLKETVQVGIQKPFENTEFSGVLVELLPDFTKIEFPDSLKGYISNTRLMRDVSNLLGIANFEPDQTVESAFLDVNAQICKPEEREKLQNAVENSSLIAKRWNVIEHAYDQHCMGNYVISIPLLLIQLEGLFSDALWLKGYVLKKGGKFYKKDPNGSEPKLNKHGDPIELKGLYSKADQSRIAEKGGLYLLANHIMDRLYSERNPILHGSKIDYAHPKLSIKLVLILTLLAYEINAYENSNEEHTT